MTFKSDITKIVKILSFQDRLTKFEFLQPRMRLMAINFQFLTITDWAELVGGGTVARSRPERFGSTVHRTSTLALYLVSCSSTLGQCCGSKYVNFGSGILLSLFSNNTTSRAAWSESVEPGPPGDGWHHAAWARELVQPVPVRDTRLLPGREVPLQEQDGSGALRQWDGQKKGGPRAKWRELTGARILLILFRLSYIQMRRNSDWYGRGENFMIDHWWT